MDKQIWHIEKHRSRHTNTNNLHRDVTCRVRWIWFEVSIQSVDGTHNIPMQSIESVVMYWSIYSKMQLKSFYIICLFYVQTYIGNINIKLAILSIFNIYQAYKLDFKQRSHVFAPLSVPLDGWLPWSEANGGDFRSGRVPPKNPPKHSSRQSHENQKTTGSRILSMSHPGCLMTGSL